MHILYNLLLKLIWLYDIQLWGTAKKSSTCIKNTSVPIKNPLTIMTIIYSNIIYIFHKDLHIPKVTEKAKLYYSKFRNLLQNYTNPNSKKYYLSPSPELPRRLSDKAPIALKIKIQIP